MNDEIYEDLKEKLPNPGTLIRMEYEIDGRQFDKEVEFIDLSKHVAQDKEGGEEVYYCLDFREKDTSSAGSGRERITLNGLEDISKIRKISTVELGTIYSQRL